MSIYDYKKSQEISMEQPPFASLVMAAIRKADSRNLVLLERAWPEIYAELVLRYDAPGGYLPGEKPPTQGENNGS